MSDNDTDRTRKLPLGDGVRIVAEHSAGLIALEKPEGIMAHPNNASDLKKSLIQTPYDLDGEFYSIHGDAGTDTKIHLLNRIDSPTSGLVLLATNADIAEQVRGLFRENMVGKVYYAIVRGAHFHPKFGTWQDNLSKTSQGGVVRSTTGGRGFSAITRYSWMRSDDRKQGVSLVQLEPKTGRTHQLRVQCAAHGFPILGDKTYGDFTFNRRLEKDATCQRMYLHAASIKFSFQWNGKQDVFFAETPIPKEFQRVLGSAEMYQATNDIRTQISPQLKIRVNFSRRRK